MDVVERSALASIEAKKIDLVGNVMVKVPGSLLFPPADFEDRYARAFAISKPIREVKSHALGQLEWVTKHTTLGRSMSPGAIHLATQEAMREISDLSVRVILDMCDAGGVSDNEREFDVSTGNSIKSSEFVEYLREADRIMAEFSSANTKKRRESVEKFMLVVFGGVLGVTSTLLVNALTTK